MRIKRDRVWWKLLDKAIRVGMIVETIPKDKGRRGFKIIELTEYIGGNTIYIANGKKDAEAFLEGVKVGRRQMKEVLEKWAKCVEFETGLSFGDKDEKQ